MIYKDTQEQRTAEAGWAVYRAAKKDENWLKEKHKV